MKYTRDNVLPKLRNYYKGKNEFHQRAFTAATHRDSMSLSLDDVSQDEVTLNDLSTGKFCERCSWIGQQVTELVLGRQTDVVFGRFHIQQCVTKYFDHRIEFALFW